jgi:hypothetical protein
MPRLRHNSGPIQSFGDSRNIPGDICAECSDAPRRIEMMLAARTRGFYGWHVVSAAFALAVFGWGLSFYGPPIYLHAVRAARGWPLALISAAVTAHFLIGAGIGNAMSLPPLIAPDGIRQGRCPARRVPDRGHRPGRLCVRARAFGLIREFVPSALDANSGTAVPFFAAAAFVQGLAIGAFLAGRVR